MAGFPPPDKAKHLLLLAKAMELRAASYQMQADSVVFDPTGTEESKRIRIRNYLDLSEDYKDIAQNFANLTKEESRILVVPSMTGIKGK